MLYFIPYSFLANFQAFFSHCNWLNWPFFLIFQECFNENNWLTYLFQTHIFQKFLRKQPKIHQFHALFYRIEESRDYKWEKDHFPDNFPGFSRNFSISPTDWSNQWQTQIFQKFSQENRNGPNFILYSIVQSVQLTELTIDKHKIFKNC